MAVTTVAQLAAELNRPASTLLEQLQAAGVNKASAEDSLNESDKERLLDHLRTAHGTGGAERKKITLTRKSTSEIKQADASGKARTIQVEVRKKRVFVKREDGVDDATAAAAEEAELKRREEEVQAQAEALRQQEEELARKMREREDARLSDVDCWIAMVLSRRFCSAPIFARSSFTCCIALSIVSTAAFAVETDDTSTSEMLNVLSRSPPVPQTSKISRARVSTSSGTETDRSRSSRANTASPTWCRKSPERRACVTNPPDRRAFPSRRVRREGPRAHGRHRRAFASPDIPSRPRHWGRHS